MNGVCQLFQTFCFWPRNKYREILRNVAKWTPYEKWEIVWKLGNSTSILLGVYTWDDCRWTWRTLLPLFLGIEVGSLSLYTIFYYWNENKISAIQPLSLLAIAIPVRTVRCHK